MYGLPQAIDPINEFIKANKECTFYKVAFNSPAAEVIEIQLVAKTDATHVTCRCTSNDKVISVPWGEICQTEPEAIAAAILLNKNARNAIISRIAPEQIRLDILNEKIQELENVDIYQQFCRAIATTPGNE